MSNTSWELDKKAKRKHRQNKRYICPICNCSISSGWIERHKLSECSVGCKRERMRKPAGERIAEAAKIIIAFVDDYPCRFDHHGFCQEHLAEVDGRCANAVAREWLQS